MVSLKDTVFVGENGQCTLSQLFILIFYHNGEYDSSNQNVPTKT